MCKTFTTISLKKITLAKLGFQDKKMLRAIESARKLVARSVLNHNFHDADSIGRWQAPCGFPVRFAWVCHMGGQTYRHYDPTRANPTYLHRIPSARQFVTFHCDEIFNFCELSNQ